MLKSEFLPILAEAPTMTVINDPYWKVVVEAKDHTVTYRKSLLDWSRNVTCDTATAYGRKVVGLFTKNSNSTAELTQTVNFPETGDYRVEIEAAMGSTDTGGIEFYDGSTLIEDYKSNTHERYHAQRHVYGLREYSSGNHDLKVKLYRQAFVAYITIYKINKYVGSSEDEGIPSDERLDIKKIEFTKNNVNEINKITINCNWKEPFYKTENQNSLMCFDYTDSITVYAGPTRRLAEPIYGGYITALSKDENKLTIEGLDRLLDLMRQKIYHNFAIGAAPTSDDTKTLPYTCFGSVYELARYLAETCEYSLKTYLVPYEHGFYLNFGNILDYTAISTSIFKKQLDLDFGMPKPSLKLVLGEETGNAYATFFDSVMTWDAAIYGLFSFDYYASGAGAKYPLEFNVQFTMHKAGQTVADAVNYIIHFSGSPDANNVIGDVKPIRDGMPQQFKVNIKSLFDSFAPSTEYNISKISFVGDVTSDTLMKPRCSSIWIDNMSAYRVINNNPHYASQDVKTAFEELQQVCEKTNHVAFVRPGEERRDDVLVVLPADYSLSSEVVEEGANLIDLGSWEYSPYERGYSNQAHITFNFNEDQSGVAYYQDENEIQKYGPFEHHNFESDINNQVDADLLAKDYVASHFNFKTAHEVEIIGTTLIEPSEYILAIIKSNKIVGTRKIKAIKHIIEPDGAIAYKTSLDLETPTRRYLEGASAMKREIRNLGISGNIGSYKDYGGNLWGGTSSGAFI